jgi:hypothetical protein
MSAQVVDEELGLGVGDAAEQRKPVITVSTKNHSPRDANEAENTLQNDTTSSGGNEHVETHRESGAVRSNAVSTGNAGGPSGTNAGSQNNHRKFEPIPPCSWEVSLDEEHRFDADRSSVHALAHRKSSSATHSWKNGS